MLSYTDTLHEEGSQMKNQWNATKQRRIPVSDISGLYIAHTETGRYILTYSSSTSEAYDSIYNTIATNDRIVSIARDKFL